MEIFQAVTDLINPVSATELSEMTNFVYNFV